MKTFEEQAREYADDVMTILTHWDGPDTPVEVTVEAILEKAFLAGAKAATRWIPVRDEMPGAGVEVVGFNPQWIDEDFNPNGTRICCQTMAGDLEEGEEVWLCATWNNTYDCYDTVDYPPTHWLPIPTKQEK